MYRSPTSLLLSLLLRSLGGLLTVAPFLSRSSLSFSHAHAHHHHHHDDSDDHRCATAEPTLRGELVERLRFQGAFDESHRPEHRRLLETDCDRLCDQCIEIGVNLHLILGNITGFGVLVPHPTDVVLDILNDRTDSRRDLSTQQDIVAMFEENIAVVNRAFRGTPFRFRFNDPDATTATVNNDWSNDAVEFQREMSQALGSRDLRTLDVFVAWNLRTTGTGGRVLGIATLPAAQLAGQGDGVIVRYDVLTGGGLGDNDVGHTLTHEIGEYAAAAVRAFGCFFELRAGVSHTNAFVFHSSSSRLFSGHWLGLFHTFQQLTTTEACDPDEEPYADFVADTPIHDGPSSGMAESCVLYLEPGGLPLPDSCPDLPGSDPIFNYMNYVDNERCQEEQGEFTCGQISRMYRHWLLFRDLVNTCEDPGDMQIEVVVEKDISYVEDTLILLEDERGEVLFNSVADQLVAGAIFEQEAFLFDLCVPREESYVLSVLDRSRNGFQDGSVEVYVDRGLVANVTGDFGLGVTVTIEARDVPTPTSPAVPPTGTPTNAPTSAPTEPPTRAPTIPMPDFSGILPDSSSITKVTSSPSAAPSLVPTESPSSPVARPSSEESIEAAPADASSSSSATRVASLGAAALFCGWILF